MGTAYWKHNLTILSWFKEATMKKIHHTPEFIASDGREETEISVWPAVRVLLILAGVLLLVAFKYEIVSWLGGV
jgi:hypothetical protein